MEQTQTNERGPMIKVTAISRNFLDYMPETTRFPIRFPSFDTIRDQFLGSDSETVYISWDDELTIDDIICSTLRPGDVNLSRKFHETFTHNPGHGGTRIITVSENNVDKQALLYFASQNHWGNVFLFSDDGPYKFQPGFLEECWERACYYEAECLAFGDTVKKLGYIPNSDFNRFKEKYANSQVQLKSAGTANWGYN